MPGSVAQRLEEARPGSRGWARLRLYSGGSQGAELWGSDSGLLVVVKRHPGAPLRHFEAIARRVETLRRAGLPAPATSVAVDGTDVLLVHDHLPGSSDPALTRPLVEDLLAASRLGIGLADESAGEWQELIRSSLTVGLDGYCQHESLESFSAESRALLEQVRAVGRDSSLDRLVADDLIHYDLHPDNVLSVDDQSITGIIDWDAVRAGDRALDLALLFFTSSWRATDAVLEQLWAAFLASGTRDARIVYMHHVVLRLVDWIIRHDSRPGPEHVVDLGRWALSITATEAFHPPPQDYGDHGASPELDGK